jgi:hypothetical protein
MVGDRWLRSMFHKLSATADHYIGGRSTRGPFSYRHIPLNHKEHAIALLSGKRRKIIVKVAINNFFISTKVN